jgi:hypothetical protein
MEAVWEFLRKSSNQKVLSWLGGGGVVIAGGIWVVVTYVWPHEPPPGCVQAQQASIAAARNASGNTITYNGGTPAGGNTATCPDTAKK